LSSQGGFGPDFQAAGSKLYRAEYAAATAAILAYLAYRWLYQGGIDWPSTVFWILFPDLVAFIPIGLSSKRKEWPAWGGYLYNVFHSILVWVPVFVLSWLVLGTPYVSLLGWLGHITADRAGGIRPSIDRQAVTLSWSTGPGPHTSRWSAASSNHGVRPRPPWWPSSQGSRSRSSRP